MDDCNLSKLSVKPGALIPPFKTAVTEYNVTVPSSADKITFDPITSDSGASFAISGSGGSRDVPLKEGVITDVKIEVTAEDGTTKNYFIHVKRLSAKDAVLSDIKVKDGNLEPAFNPNQTLYYCLLPSNVANAAITPKAPDPKNAIQVGGQANKPVPLNTGSTKIDIEVTSADGSNKKMYTLEVVRKQIPRYVKFQDQRAAANYECPISLSPLYCPITVKGSNPKHTFSGPFIMELTKISKVDPLSGRPLEPGWSIEDSDVDKKMAQQMATIPLTYSGATQPRKFGELAVNLQECNKPPKLEDVGDKFKNSSLTLKRTYQETKWEKALQQVHDETKPETLVKSAENYLKEYYQRIPKPGHFHHQYAEDESPIDSLQHAIHCLATAVKFKPKDANIHLQLAMVLEEKYLAEDMFGLKKEEKDDFMSMNIQAKESSKEEECMAICKLRGVDPSAPVSLQLIAIDQEYHQLISSGQSGKADHVQALFAWFSKKVSQEGAAAHKAEDNQSPLGQAYQKYLDALCQDETKAIYNFHVGRMLVIQGNYEEAIKRLEAALCWNAQHEMSRFYLGLAISLSKSEWKQRGKEAVGYLLAGMELVLTELCKQACKAEEIVPKTSLFANNLMRISNVHFLRGLIQTGSLLMSNEVKDSMSATDVFHTAALLAAQVLPTISRGDTYKQIEWVLLDAHTTLLELLSRQQKGNEGLIASRCQRLSALIFNSTIAGNSNLLKLQEETCQKLVRIQPSHSYSLFLLGASQFALYENNPSGESAKQMLTDAKSSLEASISLEGKTSDSEPSSKLTEQKWWSATKKTDKDSKEAPAKPGSAKGKAAASPATPSTAKVGAAVKAPSPARGASTANRGAAARGRGVAASSSNTQAKGDKSTGHVCVAKPKGVAARGGAAVSRGGAAAARGAKAAPAGKATPAAEPKKEEEVKKEEPKKEEEMKAEPVKQVVITNPKSHQARLALARVLRADEKPDEAKKYYNEVIEMAPEIHDAYIESAEMLAKSNPIEAVDVYDKFPVSENPNFDDAYIFGEICRILMKAEKYDDERLAKNMIAYGRVLGVGVLERYTKTLEEKHKNDLLKKVYAGVNHKSVDDPDMQAFFKFKFWI